LRRMVFVPTMKAAALHARVVLAAMSLAALLVFAGTLASPVAAQENETRDASGERGQSVQEGGQQAVDPLEGQTATIEEDSIGPIAVADCEATAGETASITVADADDAATREIFTDGTGAVFGFGAQGVTISGEGDDNLGLGDLEDSRTGEVVRSQGITCGDDDSRQRADDDDAADDDAARTADDLENLSCTKLLVLFRSDSSSERQYGDAAALADPEVRARIELCLEKEIVQGTAADGDLPKTGGLSLIGLAALGAATAVVGLSVIRGVRR
jgi:hypothetical protein